jgi:hypothetical protein
METKFFQFFTITFQVSTASGTRINWKLKTNPNPVLTYTATKIIEVDLSPDTKSEIIDVLSTGKSKMSNASVTFTSSLLPEKLSGSRRHQKITQTYCLHRICRFQNLAISATILVNQAKLRDDRKAERRQDDGFNRDCKALYHNASPIE